MDLLAMNHTKKVTVLPVLLAILICSIGSAHASDLPDTISMLEQHLFFNTYGKEDMSSRLSRLEKQVFGQSLTGSIQERLDRLSSIAPVTVHTQAPETATKPASPQTKIHEDACYLERAKVAVMAAKEEEIINLLAQGVELWRAKRAAEALEKFEQVLRLDAHNAEAHFSMGIIEEKAGNLQEALISYRLAAEARPDNAEYKTALLSMQKKLNGKQTQNADGQPQDIRQLTEDAVAAYKRGEYISALELYKTIDQKAPNQALTKYNIGTVYLIIKQPEKALGYYQQAHKLNPQDERITTALNKLKDVVAKNQTSMAQMGAKTKQSGKDKHSSTASASLEQSVMASYGILGKSQDDGVYITTIGIASRAMQVGLQRGDIIRAADGTIVRNPSELNQILSRKQRSAPVQLMVQRQNSLAPVLL